MRFYSSIIQKSKRPIGSRQGVKGALTGDAQEEDGFGGEAEQEEVGHEE